MTGTISDDILIDDDAQLDTSVISVIHVDDDADKIQAEKGEDGKIEDENLTLISAPIDLTLSVAQFEMMISDLNTKHIAEKRMLQCDLTLCKKMIQLMAISMRDHGKERQKNQVRLL